jgi:outer membrane protein
MIVRAIRIFAGVLFIFFVFGDGQAQEPWTLQKCIDYAMANNPELQAAEARIEASGHGLDFQKSQFLPRFDLNTSTGALSGAPTSPYAVIKGLTEEGIRVKDVSGGYVYGGVEVNIPIVKEGAWFARNAPSINMAAQQVSVDKNVYAAKKSEIAYAVSTSFLALLKNYEDTKVAAEHLKSLKSNYSLTLSKFKEGLLAKNQLLIAETNLAAGDRELTTYQNMTRVLMTDLSVKMGLEPMKSITVTGDNFMPPFLSPLDQLIRDALTNRPEIVAQQTRVALAREDLRRAESERYPKLEITSSYGVANDYGSHNNSLWIAGLRSNVPIFDFGGISSKIKSLQAKVTEEEKLLASLKGTTAQEVVAAYTSIGNTKSDITVKEKMVEQAAENAKLVKARFDQNLAPLSAVLEAEYVLYANQKALTESKYNLRGNYLQLLIATATN